MSDMVFEMLYLLIKKFGFNNETKLEPLLSDIFYKVLIVEEQLHSIISLLVTVVRHMKFPKAILFIEEICAKNPSQHAAFYLFQALALVRENFPNATDFATISQTIATSSLWDGSRTDINLMMLEIFFMKTSQAEGLEMLRRLDGSLL